MAIQLEDLKKKQAADNEINWITASFMTLFHLGAIAALFFFTWKAFFLALALWWIAGGFGIPLDVDQSFEWLVSALLKGLSAVRS